MKIERQRGWKRFGVGLVAVVAMSMALGGCANQQNYDQLLDTVRTQDEQIQKLQRDLKERESELAALQRTGNSGDAALQAAMRARDDAEAKLAAAMAKLNELDGRLSSASLSPLDTETDSALRDLASKFPNLISYDSSRGMLRFNSDLTFDSGQAVVKDSAKSSLDALANVLNSASASSYEVMIVGHTDSQRVSEVTRQRGHLTNMHLSCHRAIAVRDALAGMRVPSNKMYAAGWGEERPAVPNRGNGNTPENRRVEIFLTNSTAGGAQASRGNPDVAPAPVPVDRTNPPNRQPDMTK